MPAEESIFIHSVRLTAAAVAWTDSAANQKHKTMQSGR